MKCILCQKTLDLLDPNKVTITMEPDNGNRFLLRVFYVCEKCAYRIVEKFYKADPICKKCDVDENTENAETD